MKFILRVALPLLLLGYIAIETYLKLNHSSLCAAEGCKIAGELLRFNPIFLNYFGIAGTLLLAIFGYLSLKNSWAGKLFFTLLYGAIAFEATILGYQFFANPEPCVFCMGIFSSLVLIALVNAPKNFITPLAVAMAIIAGLSSIAIPKNQSFMQKEGLYLIHSDNCPHCKKVKAYFEKEHINYTPLTIKEASARGFLKYMNVTSIPVLVNKGSEQTTIIVGDHKIITHYEQTKEHTTTKPQESTASTILPELTSDFLGAGGHDDGCAITITETPSCEKNTSTTSP